MFYKRLTVRNVGPHRALDLEFQRGLVGVVGANGAGKTVVLEMLSTAVTGNFGARDSVKEDWVCDLAREGEPSFFEAEIEFAGGVVATVRRSFRPNGVRLAIPGEPVLTTADKVQARLAALVGWPADEFDLLVFRRQGRLDEFLTLKASDRKRLFGKLFGAAVLDRLWKAVGEAVADERPAEVALRAKADAAAAAAAEVEDATTALKQIAARAAAARSKLLSGPSQESAQRIVQAAAEVKKAEEARARAEADLKTEEAALEAADRVRVSTQARYEAAEARLAAAAGDDQSELLAEWAEYDAYVGRRDRIAADKEKAIEATQRLVDPGRPSDPDAVATLTERLYGKRVELSNLHKQLNAVEGVGGLGTCPTCGSDLKDVESFADALRADVGRLTAEVAEAYEKLRIEKASADAWAAYVRDRAAADAELARLDKLAEFLVEVDRPARPRPVKTPGEDRVAVQRQLAGTKTLLDEATRLVANKTAAVAAIRGRLLAAAERIATAETDLAMIERARTRLAEHARATVEIATLKGQADGHEARIAKYGPDAAQAVALAAEAERAAGALAVATELRGVLHQDAAQKDVIAAGMVAFSAEVNRHLAVMQAPFSVAVDEEARVFATFPGGKPRAAARLSGGQRAVLSVAIAEAASTGGRCGDGMLVLDEPTAHLDADGQRALVRALSNLSAAVRGRRQVIVVTHAEAVRPAFDQLIEL